MLSLMVLATATIVALVGFLILGGRFYDVRTASMGIAAPPGSLVVTWPAAMADIGVGDIVTFRPPTSPGRVYTHRVVAVDAGRFITRGDANAVDDPWRVGSGDLVGAAAVVVPGGGYAMRLIPIVAIGTLLIFALSKWWVSSAYRAAARLLGIVLVISFALVRVQPLMNVHSTQTVVDENSARFTIQSAGVLPLRVTAVANHGVSSPTRFTYGSTNQVVVSGQAVDGKYLLVARLFLSGLQRLGLLVVCLLPFFVSVRIVWRPVMDPAGDTPVVL